MRQLSRLTLPAKERRHGLQTACSGMRRLNPVHGNNAVRSASSLDQTGVATMPQARFMFTVSGPSRTGVLYVWAPCADPGMPRLAELAHAAVVAARRSGDPAPVFVRIAN